MTIRLITALKLMTTLKQNSGSGNIPNSTTESPPLSSTIGNVNEVSLNDIFINPILSPILLPIFNECAKHHVMLELPLFYTAYLELRRATCPNFIPQLLLTPGETTTAIDEGLVLDAKLTAQIIEEFVNPTAETSLNLSGTLRSQVMAAHSAGNVPTRLVEAVAKEAGRSMITNLMPVFRSYLANWIAANDHVALVSADTHHAALKPSGIAN